MRLSDAEIQRLDELVEALRKQWKRDDIDRLDVVRSAIEAAWEETGAERPARRQLLTLTTNEHTFLCLKGTEKTTTTPLMKTPTPHENAIRLAIGYVRVSTHEQAQDGVSLEVQRDKLRAYCRLHDIKLVDIRADEGMCLPSVLDIPKFFSATRR